jgi:hypothetical protein
MGLLPSTRGTLALCSDHGKVFRKGEKKCMQSPEQSQNHALELPRWRGRNRAACFRPCSPNILTRETLSQACELFAIRTFGLRYIKQASRPRESAKDQRRPFLGAPWAGSRACPEPSRAEFADRKHRCCRSQLRFRSGPATPAADRDRRPRHAWPGTEGIRWPWPRAQSADRTGRIRLSRPV